MSFDLQIVENLKVVVTVRLIIYKMVNAERKYFRRRRQKDRRTKTGGSILLSDFTLYQNCVQFKIYKN